MNIGIQNYINDKIKQTAWNINKEFEDKTNIYASLRGILFGKWINQNSRQSGFSNSVVVENPVYVVESIIRDMILIEKDLLVSSTEGRFLSFNGINNKLTYNLKNYYLGAYVRNVSKNWESKVVSHDYKTNKLEIFDSYEISVGDKCYLTNVQGDELIDFASFDFLGNLTNGLIKDYKIALGIYEEIKAIDLLNNILSECNLSLLQENKKYKIVYLGVSNAVGVLSKATFENGQKSVEVNYSNPELIYNDFVLNYSFNDQVNNFRKQIFVNKNSSSNAELDNYKSICLEVERKYKISKSYEINLKYVDDDFTAIEILKTIIEKHSDQWLEIIYKSGIKNHLQYQKGDIVRVNEKTRLPERCNVLSRFIINKIDIVMNSGSPLFIFKLQEIYRDLEFSLIDRNGNLIYDRDGNQLFSRIIEVGEVLTDRDGTPILDKSGNYIFARA